MNKYSLLIEKKWGIKGLRALNDFNNIIYSQSEIKFEHEKIKDFLLTCDKHQGCKI